MVHRGPQAPHDERGLEDRTLLPRKLPGQCVLKTGTFFPYLKVKIVLGGRWAAPRKSPSDWELQGVRAAFQLPSAFLSRRLSLMPHPWSPTGGSLIVPGSRPDPSAQGLGCPSRDEGESVGRQGPPPWMWPAPHCMEGPSHASSCPCPCRAVQMAEEGEASGWWSPCSRVLWAGRRGGKRTISFFFF